MDMEGVSDALAAGVQAVHWTVDWTAAHVPTQAQWLHALLTYWDVLRIAIMVSAVIILVSSLDDLMIDAAYWFGQLEKLVDFRHWPPKQAKLDRHPQKLIAIMVPAWQESDVIASMVANTNNTFDYGRYHIFVGVYANDPDTRREVDKVRQRFPNVHRAEVPHDGPTSKADCLNWIIQNILLHEQKTGDRFEAFLMHDAEDVVHPYGLKTVNWFIDNAAMIQMPVLSMDRRWNQLVACHYMDEFAEFHTKDLPVRSSFAGMTPSAGVATAFHRAGIMALIKEKDGQPFNTDSLTEDYDIAHRLSALGFHSEFVRYHARVTRQRKAILHDGMVDYRPRELVATKEFFPDKLRTSVRQKARWMLGISIMGWAQLGWFGGLINRYYLYRDRKALFTAPVGILGYVIVAQLLAYLLVEWLWPHLLDLPPVIEHHWVWVVVTVNLGFALNRLFHRAYFTFINHGLKHVWLTPVRVVVSNIISFGAFMRASRQYAVHLVTRRPIAWDKTQHSYPSLSELQQGSGRLGETLRFWNHVTEADLNGALAEQKNRYRPLGLLLLDLAAVEDESLAEAFAEAADTYASMFDPFQIERPVLDLLSQKDAAWFGAVPLRRTGDALDVALAEPLGPDKRGELERWLGQQGIRSVRFLFAPLSDIAFAVRFARGERPFDQIREQLARLHERGVMDATQEAVLWRSVRAGYTRLGDLLVRAGSVSHVDLQAALAEQRRTGRMLGETLVAGDKTTSAQIDAALYAQRTAGWINEALAGALRQMPAGAPAAVH